MKKRTFERSLEKLEKIVEELETGELPLDSSLKKYEEGVKLAGECQLQLDEARKTIEILIKDRTGKISRTKYKEE